MLYTCAEPFHLVQITGTICCSREMPQTWEKAWQTRATDELGNKRISLSFSEETSLPTVAGNARLQLLGVHREKNQLCHSLTQYLFGMSSAIPPWKTLLVVFVISTFSFWEGHDSAASPINMEWAIKSNVLQTTQKWAQIFCVWGALGYLTVLVWLFFGRRDGVTQHDHLPQAGAQVVPWWRRPVHFQ